jgi:hypothetical protein
MFANLQNPMAYIIGFQMAVLLVPACAALARFLRDERRATRMESPAARADVIYLGESPRETSRAA